MHRKIFITVLLGFISLLAIISVIQPSSADNILGASTQPSSLMSTSSTVLTGISSFTQTVTIQVLTSQTSTITYGIQRTITDVVHTIVISTIIQPYIKQDQFYVWVIMLTVMAGLSPGLAYYYIKRWKVNSAAKAASPEKKD